MKQREPPAKIFVDDGVGRAGDGFREAKPTGKSPSEGGLPRPKIAPVGKNRPGGDDLPYRRADFFRFLRGVCDKFHVNLPY